MSKKQVFIGWNEDLVFSPPWADVPHLAWGMRWAEGGGKARFYSKFTFYLARDCIQLVFERIYEASEV